jgi:hypothetical protein
MSGASYGDISAEVKVTGPGYAHRWLVDDAVVNARFTDDPDHGVSIVVAGRQRPADPMPVFTIKAKDTLAIETIVAYRDFCLEQDLTEQAAQVELALDEIEAWQRANPDQVKLPDHTHVPVGVSAGYLDDLSIVGPSTSPDGGAMRRSRPAPSDKSWIRGGRSAE